MQSLGWLTRFLRSVALLLLIVPAYAPAQTDLNYYHHQAWSTEDGLPQNSVHALAETQQGRLLLGTEAGFASFDGLAFHANNLSGLSCSATDDITALAADPKGDLWIGTTDGVFRLRGSACERYDGPNGSILRDVQEIGVIGDQVLLRGDGNLFLREGNSFSPFSGAPPGSLFAPLKTGALIATPNGEVRRWPGSSAAANTVDGRSRALPQSLGVAVGPSGEVWSFNATELQRWSGLGAHLWRIGKDLPGDRIQALQIDRSGSAWVGTNRGLDLVSAKDDSALLVPELHDESVLSLLIDRENDVWIGTEISGLHVLQPRRFGIEPGTSLAAVTAVVRRSDGVLCFGTRNDGVKCPGSGLSFGATSLTSPVVLSLAAASGNELWVGTPDGLDQIASNDVRHWTVAEGLPDNFIRGLATAQDGSLWVGTRFGLAHLDRGGIKTITLADGLRSDSVGPLVVTDPEGRDERLWVGTAAGVCFSEQQSFRCVGSDKSSRGAVAALATETRDSVWAAFQGKGLALVTQQQALFVRSKALPSKIAGLLAFDDWLWIRGSRGLYRVRRQLAAKCALRSDSCDDLSVDSFGRADGMGSEELAGEGAPLIAADVTGKLWIATRRGVAVTDPAHLRGSGVPPRVEITQAWADGVPIPLNGSARISPGQRQLSFEYAASALNNPLQTRYQYRLEGFDREWVNAGSRRTATYTNLSPKSYVFHVRARSGEGLWSSADAMLAFDVLPPWYRRAWAFVLEFLLVAACVAALVQARVLAERRRLTLLLQERTRVAREVHDTLAQDLVSVSYQVEIAAQHARAGRTEEVLSELSRTRQLVRQTLESARQSIWNLRSGLSLESLPERVKAKAERLQTPTRRVQVRIGGEYRAVEHTKEEEVMRIVGEALANVQKHAEATALSIEMLYTAASLRITIHDDGKGFDPASARGMPGHYGLRGLEERAALLRGTLHLISSSGQGTTLTLEVPWRRENRRER